MYVTSRHGSGKRGRLVSPDLAVPGPLCLHFWYHMIGEDVGALEIHQQQIGKQKQRLWSVTEHTSKFIILLYPVQNSKAFQT